MNFLARHRRLLLPLLPPTNGSNLQHVRWWARPNSSRGKVPLNLKKGGISGGSEDGKPSEWWIVDGEMHEVGDNVPHRERFVIPRDNLPNRRRKQMREQFMRRTRLVLKESEHEPWCRRYMELYNEQRENWERLYWDEGYSKKIAQDYANYESAEDDDLDFSPYRRSLAHTGQNKDQSFVGNQRDFGGNQRDFGGNRQDDTWRKVGQIRDKFEYDRERRMRDKAFAPMNMASNLNARNSASRIQPFDTDKFFP